jgi:hypothetical protein
MSAKISFALIVFLPIGIPLRKRLGRHDIIRGRQMRRKFGSGSVRKTGRNNLKNKKLLIIVACLTIASLVFLMREAGMDKYIITSIGGIGSAALIAVIMKMQGGFNQANLRAIGIVLVATFASLLAMKDGGSLTAAMGILGAIVGYLFGIKDSKLTPSNE